MAKFRSDETRIFNSYIEWGGWENILDLSTKNIFFPILMAIFILGILLGMSRNRSFYRNLDSRLLDISNNKKY